MSKLLKTLAQYMIERENKSTTYIGNSVAIPHGTLEGKAQVIKTGIVINQYPNGVDFGNGNKAYFLIQQNILTFDFQYLIKLENEIALC